MNYDEGADINSDGIVNIFDMVLLGKNWGDGTSTSAFTPNLPTSSGLQLITDTRFVNMQNQQYNADGLAYNYDGRTAIDNSAPHGSNVFETFYPGNDLGNGVGGSIIYDQGNNSWREMYFSLAMWVPANYSMHSNGEKFLYPLYSTNGVQVGSSPVNFAAIVGGANGTNFGFIVVPRPWTAFEPQNGAAMVPKGQWTRVELYMRMNTPGSSNGVLTVWVDDAIALNRSDIRYSDAATQSVWNGIRFDGTRGGGASDTPTPAGGQVRRYNRLAFYAAN